MIEVSDDVYAHVRIKDTSLSAKKVNARTKLTVRSIHDLACLYEELITASHGAEANVVSESLAGHERGRKASRYRRNRKSSRGGRK